jgi:hypothetical protein
MVNTTNEKPKIALRRCGCDLMYVFSPIYEINRDGVVLYIIACHMKKAIHPGTVSLYAYSSWRTNR